MQYRPHRYPTEFPIHLQAPSGPLKCALKDVNETGAKVQGAGHLERGQKVSFQVLNHKAEAVVRWVSGERAGLVFRPKLTALQVDTLRYRRDRGHYNQRHSNVHRYPEMI